MRAPFPPTVGSCEPSTLLCMRTSSRPPCAHSRSYRPGWSGASTPSARALPCARNESDEQAAVLVVGGEKVRLDFLRGPGACAHRDLLVEPAHAPFECQTRGVLLALALEPEHILQLATEELGLRETREL